MTDRDYIKVRTEIDHPETPDWYWEVGGPAVAVLKELNLGIDFWVNNGEVKASVGEVSLVYSPTFQKVVIHWEAELHAWIKYQADKAKLQQAISYAVRKPVNAWPFPGGAGRG